MASDGSSLEEFVSFVEEQFLPEGLTIRTREKIFEHGVIVAELDIVVSGRVGTADFSWLIECRDRPSEGAAPVSWIEQLHGRRQRFNFNKVTAVSTTGFSEGARSYAASIGIEIRELATLEVDAFKDWIASTHMQQFVNNCDLERATLYFAEEDLSAHGAQLTKILEEATASNSDVIRRSATGEIVKAANAFRAAVEPQEGLWNQVETNGAAKTVAVMATYTNDADHFIVDVNGTPVRVRRILYRGKLTRTESAVPIEKAGEYRAGDKHPISQFVSYQPMDVNGVKVGVEFHRMPDIEEAFVILRTSKGD